VLYLSDGKALSKIGARHFSFLPVHFRVGKIEKSEQGREQNQKN